MGAADFAEPPVNERLNELDRAAQLRYWMVRWRRRLKADQIPGLVSGGRIRRFGHVSQEDMAYLTGVTPSWYGALERGDLDRGYSDAFLDKVAAALRLNTGERRALYLLVTGREPTPRPYAPPLISPAVQASLEALPWPAFIVDAAWEILAFNPACLDWFRTLEWESNWMRLVLCYPESRMQWCDWTSIDAPLMLAQLRAQLAKMPDHEPLKELVAFLLGTEGLAQIWEDEARVYFHDDGDRRSLLVPGATEPTEVEVLSWMPFRNPDLRGTAFIPVGGFIPESCRSRCRSCPSK